MDTTNRQVLDLLKQLSDVQKSVTEITDYKSAVKHVVYYTVKNKEVMDEVRSVVEEQKKSENELIDLRKELIRKQQSREKGQEEITKLFKMLGAEAKEKDGISQQKELEQFDYKVYKKMVELSKRQHQILADLKIPLFCLQASIPKPIELQHDRQKLLDLLYNLAS